MKTEHRVATEQNRPNVASGRARRKRHQPKINPARLVFDEHERMAGSVAVPRGGLTFRTATGAR